MPRIQGPKQFSLLIQVTTVILLPFAAGFAFGKFFLGPWASKRL